MYIRKFIHRFKQSAANRVVFLAWIFMLFLVHPTLGDGLLFSYEGDILPGDPGSDLVIANACEPDCSRRLENGHFLLEWGMMGNIVTYAKRIAEPPDLPPATLWVEWRFRSNQPWPGSSTGCDARFLVDYVQIVDEADMYQDAVHDFESGDLVLGLDPNVFRTYRFESLDGANYTMSVDGVVFNSDTDSGGNEFHTIQFGGLGSCVAGPERPIPVRSEWDFVRYGTISDGETIVSSIPSEGLLTDSQASGITSILVTFDSPNYAYMDDISVTATSGVAPNVIATRRLDNGDPAVLEVVLDGELPAGATTTLTFADASGNQSLEFTRIPPGIPTSSTWGAIILALSCLVIGSAILRNSSPVSDC